MHGLSRLGNFWEDLRVTQLALPKSVSVLVLHCVWVNGCHIRHCTSTFLHIRERHTIVISDFIFLATYMILRNSMNMEYETISYLPFPSLSLQLLQLFFFFIPLKSVRKWSVLFLLLQDYVELHSAKSRKLLLKYPPHSDFKITAACK